MKTKIKIIFFISIIAAPFLLSSQSQDVEDSSNINATSNNFDSLYYALNAKIDS